MEKRKILIFGMTAGYGGVESFVMNYFRNMDRNDFEFHFLCYNIPPAYAEEIEKSGGKIIIVPGRGKNPIASKAAINRVFRENKYYAVWSNLCYLSDITVLKSAKKSGVPVRIIHAHNSVNMSGRLNEILHKINKNRIKKYATDFWSCSDLAGKFFYTEDIINSSKYRVIANAVDVEKFRFNPTVRDEMRKEMGLKNSFVIGNVGRLHFQKNPIFLIKIFKAITLKNENAVLLMVGDGEMKSQIEDKCKELGITDKVRLLGRRNDVDKLMQAMDLFLMPSLFEGLPVVLVEAQSSGLCCIVSDEITKEVALTDNIKYLSLQDSAEKWAEEADLAEPYFRTDKGDIISLAGFNIKTEAEKMTGFFKE